jgi:hypothetical protein
VVGAVLLLGLGLAGAEEPPPVQAAPEEAAPVEPAAPSEPATEVTLVSPGQGKARPLRIAARRGDAWELQLRRATTLTQQLDDGAVERLASPEAVDVVRVEVGDRIEARLVDADLEGAAPAGLAALRDELAPIAGVRLVAPLDPLQRHALDVTGLPDEIGQFAAEVLGDVGFALRTTSIPLPEEPVAVGASWSWTRPTVEEGVTLTERFTAHLLERRGTGATVRVEMTATPDAPVVLEGSDSASIEIGATGKVWLDLRRPLVRAADLDLTGRLVTTWHEGDVAHRGENGFGGKLTIASRDVR